MRHILFSAAALYAVLAAAVPMPDADPQPLTPSNASSGCKKTTVIFARGTDEIGVMGQIVGPVLKKDVSKALDGDVSVQGVNYAASTPGIYAEETPAGGPGTAAMVALAKKVLGQCPKTKIVLAGYSQGAMLVHHTCANLGKTATSKVVAVVTFGDPFKDEPLENVSANKFKTFCATGDTVCGWSGISARQFASPIPHLSYGSDVPAAVAFIKSHVQGTG